MANRSSFGPMVLVVAAMSCSFYVACGDDDVIFGMGGTGGTGADAGGNGGTGGRPGGAGGGGAGGTAGVAGTGGGGTGGGAGVGGSGSEPEPDAGPDAAPPDSGSGTND